MRNIEELEDRLCQPSPELIHDFGELEGGILILGAGGKMGPSLAKLAKRAAPEKEVIAVSRFSDASQRNHLEQAGIVTLAGDLLDEDFVEGLPLSSNVIYMAGQKFGTSGNEPYTWAMNSYLPGRIATKFRNSRMVVFSTGNVYPFVPVDQKGASESTPVAPVGEYAQSCLGRERVFEYFSRQNQTPMVIFRLNYALDLRYGVLNEIARSVWEGNSINLAMGYANVIWQGDANQYALRCLGLATLPPRFLNVTGPEVVSIQWLASKFGELLDRKPMFINQASATALLSDATEMSNLLGHPSVSLDQMIQWTADWTRAGGEQLGKPTHFQERGGTF